MLTITTRDALETTRTRVNIVLQTLLVAANVCVWALPHTLMLICVPCHADRKVWVDLPIHPDTPLAVICLAFGNTLSAPDSTSDARFLLLTAHHLQSAYLWSHVLPVLSRRDVALLLPDLASFDPAWATEVCSTTFGLPHVNLDVLVALQREWPFGVFLRKIHPQMANLVRFWDSHLPLTEVQTTCVLCKGPVIRYTPVLGPHAPTTPLFCCRSLVHSACLNIYTRSQAGGRDQQVPCLFCDTPQVETHDWRAQEAWQHDPDVRSYLDTLTPHWLAPDMSADLCWLTEDVRAYKASPQFCQRTSRAATRQARPTGTFHRQLPTPHTPHQHAIPQSPQHISSLALPPPPPKLPSSSPSPSPTRADSPAHSSAQESSSSGHSASSSTASSSQDVQRLQDELDFPDAPQAAPETSLERWLED